MQFSFLIIKNAMNQHLEKMLANATRLFVVDVSKDEIKKMSSDDIKKMLEEL